MMNVSNYPVKTMETRSRMSRSLHTNRDFEKLEPYEGKPSRTVLRGEEGSNALDLPDRPADMEQRNGRAVRKGNTVKLWGKNTVDVVIYGTEKTLDAYKFNLLKNKQMFINQINNGTIAVRRIDEDSMDEDNGMNFAEFVAILSGNTDLLNKAKLDNKIMQLEKEFAVFKKECGRAERKIAQNGQDMEKAASFIQRMEDDLEYVASYSSAKVVSLLSTGEDTAEKTGRELHRIAKTYRGNAYTVIGSYMGLELLVKSEYNLDGSFDRNTFLVEGKSGLKYRYGISGALPLGFADSALYPQATLDKLPSIIRQQRERIAKLESELPTLQAIVSRTWGRQDELDELKKECDELKKRIDESLKDNRPEQEDAVNETDTTPIPGRRATDYAA